MLLRSGPNGVQRIQAKGGGEQDSTANARPPLTPRAAPPRVREPITTAPKSAGPRVREPLSTAGVRRDTPETPPVLMPQAKGHGMPPSSKAPMVRQAPKAPAKAPPTPARTPASAREVQRAPKITQAPKHEKVLETDAWKRKFEREWAEAMGESKEEPEEQNAMDFDDLGLDETHGADAEYASDEAGEDVNAEDDMWQQNVASPDQELDDFEDPPAPEPTPPPARMNKRPAPNAPEMPGKRKSLAADAPLTPGSVEKQAEINALDEKLQKECPAWATRCTIEPGKPGQPMKLTVSMAEAGLSDEDLTSWCAWMDKRFAAAFPSGPSQSNARTRFKASIIDFSENKVGIASVKPLCALLEKHIVRCDVLRLSANNMGNDSLRCIAKFLTAFSQAPVMEIHLSRNKISAEGVRWLLGSLAMHPAYPLWQRDTQRYIPLQLNLNNSKVGLKGDAGSKLLEGACTSFSCAICMDEKYSEESKHNAIIRLCGWEQSDNPAQLPPPSVHARPIFAPAGRGVAKALPSGAQGASREEPRVVYEDDDVAVVYKPAGWSCLPQPQGVNAAWARLKPLARRQQVAELLMQQGSPPLQAWLLLHFGGDPKHDASRDQGSDRGLAHRLDAETSGPILVGKTLKGFDHAKKQIVAGILKDYVALVHGTFSTERGECRAPIDTSPYADTKCVRIDSSGQPAATVWEALAEYEAPDGSERYTLVHCRMVTLRTHQIRVHMQYLGHPLVGDRVYGTCDKPAFCPRVLLHKYRIGFFNLKNEACIEPCSLQCAADFWKALGKLRKVGGMAMMGCGAPGL